MMDSSWITTTGTAVVMVLLTVLGAYVALMLLTRLCGLRSFSKMSSFDFALTIAVGSIIASTVATESPPLLQSSVALAAIFGVRFVVAALRHHFDWVSKVVDNQPMLLMAGPEVLDDHLRRAHVSRSDLLAKLREANVLDRSRIRAVVMETTGDVSVLQGGPDDPPLDLELLRGVRGVETLRAARAAAPAATEAAGGALGAAKRPDPPRGSGRYGARRRERDLG